MMIAISHGSLLFAKNRILFASIKVFRQWVNTTASLYNVMPEKAGIQNTSYI